MGKNCTKICLKLNMTPLSFCCCYSNFFLKKGKILSLEWKNLAATPLAKWSKLISQVIAQIESSAFWCDLLRTHHSCSIYSFQKCITWIMGKQTQNEEHSIIQWICVLQKHQCQKEYVLALRRNTVKYLLLKSPVWNIFSNGSVQVRKE